MHNASSDKNNKKSKDIAVRLSRKTWETIGEFTEKSKLKKKQQVDVLVEEEQDRRKKINGVGSK